MNRRELFDLLFTYFVLSFAFALLFARPTWLTSPFTIKGFEAIVEPFKLSLVTLGISVIFHELAHRTVARKYGHHAEYRASYLGLGISGIITGMLGFLFVIPGATIVSGAVSGEYGLIAAAGPASNLLLAVIFLQIPGEIGYIGLAINLGLAFFNSLPLAGLDGRKVIESSSSLWVILFSVSAFSWMCLLKMTGIV